MIKEDLEVLINKLINQNDKYKIIKFLKEINKYFLINCKLNFKYEGKTINVLPIETEIYYYNKNVDKNIFEDKMIHKNELQQKQFGQLYFHRRGKSKDNKILCVSTKTRGDMDVCLSNSDDYYLSILIRSAFIDNTLVSGTRKICNKIKEYFNKQNKNQKEIIKFFKELENKRNIIRIQKDELNIDNIFYQKRISGNGYSEKDSKFSELNCLNLGKDAEYLNNIIITGQTFYKKYNDSKKIEKYKESLNHN